MILTESSLSTPIRPSSSCRWLSYLGLSFPIKNLKFSAAFFLICGIVLVISDNVPNIRLNVVKTIKEIASSVKDSQARDALKMSLRVLNKDEDSDVRFFAEQVVRTFG